ncbi:HAD-IA family hydrolase [Alkalibacillus almallahensis]|uniref:HAD-IA family hydrolase n=1 Tax=Alkalibacillus almallahensis TaxID=1379154 RepID=UPI00141F6649
MLFDLDDTLISREVAVNHIFSMILDKCYKDVKHSVKNDMLQTFKEYDKRKYGLSDKVQVVESFFDEFPPQYRIMSSNIQDFWDTNFPRCFSVDQNTVDIVNTLKMQYKVAIITNGTVKRQKAKLIKTNLYNYFDTVLISDEVGFRKPDKRIFDLALNRLNVRPDETLFVGDDLEKDIAGCQNANMKGIWFNPHTNKNDTEITPFAEVNSFDRLLSLKYGIDYFKKQNGK